MTSSKHIRLERTVRPARLTTVRHALLRSTMNFRNVTVSCLFRTSIPGSIPSLRLEFNPTTKVPQGPRRPRLSFFRCNCQTARSRSSTDQNKALRRPAAKAKLRPEFRVLRSHAVQKRPKILRPRLAAGRSASGKFPQPANMAASKAPVVIG